MKNLKEFVNQELQLNPEQVQVFIPTPSTYSALMYYTGLDPWSKKPVFVERDPARKQKQKDAVTQKERIRHKPKRYKDNQKIKPLKPLNYKEYKNMHKNRSV
jgi:radical SAM superfamily enzyme YgiQ (UPF0313 family)